MLAPECTNKVNKWMSKVVVFLSPTAKGALRGTYDGYGRVTSSRSWCDDDEDSLVNASAPCCYHKACWEAAGKPKHTGASRPSADQGYFFSDPTHNMAKPKTAADLPEKPVDTSAVAVMGMCRSIWTTDENGREKFLEILHGPWHPLTRKQALRLATQRMWRQVERKFKQGHAVPQIQDVTAAAERLVG